VIFDAVLNDTLRLLAVPPVGSEDQQLQTHTQSCQLTAPAPSA
jgi:hypothetical protein